MLYKNTDSTAALTCLSYSHIRKLLNLRSPKLKHVGVLPTPFTFFNKLIFTTMQSFSTRVSCSIWKWQLWLEICFRKPVRPRSLTFALFQLSDRGYIYRYVWSEEVSRVFRCLAFSETVPDFSNLVICSWCIFTDSWLHIFCRKKPQHSEVPLFFTPVEVFYWFSHPC